MQDRLDQNIERYYLDQMLDSVALERMKKTILASGRTALAQSRTWSWAGGAIAAAVMIVVAIGGLLVFSERVSEPDQIARDICTQAALVHNQKLDMEFEAAGYDELREVMAKLDFTPVEPARFHGMNMQIVGARYGMLEGRPAVQITLRDPDGGLCTLYQMRPVGELAEVSTDSREIDGLAVDLWQEKGLLMVLARPAA